MWTDVTGYDARMANVSSGAQTIILGVVNVALNVGEFGGESSDTLKAARVFLAAHFGTMNLAGVKGVTGPVSSQSAGGLSRSYAALATNQSMFGTTAAGQAFLALLRASPARAPRAV